VLLCNTFKKFTGSGLSAKRCNVNYVQNPVEFIND
jgi:hypothetical protein